MAKEDVVPSPVFSFHGLTPEQAVAARAEEDERIDRRADDRIGVHLSTCPSMRLRTMLIGAALVITLVFSGIVALASSWLSSRMQAQDKMFEAALATHTAQMHEDVRKAVREEFSYLRTNTRGVQ